MACGSSSAAKDTGAGNCDHAVASNASGDKKDTANECVQPRSSTALSPEALLASLKPIHASVLTWVPLSWLDRLIWVGYRRPLRFEDLYAMRDTDRAPALAAVLQPFRERVVAFLSESVSTGSSRRTSVTETSAKERGSTKQAKRPTLLGSLFVRFSSQWLTAGFLYAIAVTAQMAVPTFLQQLLYSLASDDFSRSQLFMANGKAIAAVIFALQICATLCGKSNDQIMRTIAVNSRTALIGAVYEKSLRLSGKSAQEFSQGRILSLVNVDIENGSLFAIVETHQSRLLKAGDDRLKPIRETLYAIRTIKLHAWEYVFKGRIAKLRDTQVRHLRNLNTIIIFVVSMAQVTPVLMPIVGLIVYTRLSSSDGFPDPAVVFPALAFYNVLVDPLFQFQSVVANFVQALVSFRRLSSFLLAEESSPMKIEPAGTSTSQSEYAIAIYNATFKWESVKLAAGSEDPESKEGIDVKRPPKGSRGLFNVNEAESGSNETPKPEIAPLFKGLDLAIPRGKLTCVVGPVGSGKSSLLSAIIGEMTRVHTEEVGEGEVHVRGRVTYTPQQPWILTDTVDGNIAFAGGHRLDQTDDERRDRLDHAMDVSMLGPDLASLSKGSLTLIGEKGVNLSGGQQARVALARAVYEDADIYLLDDPLSALDAHVGKAVFERCVVGALAEKTRVLVTHQLHVVPRADLVVVLDEGRVVESGTFSELMAKGAGGILVGMMEHHRLDDDTPRKESERKTSIVVTDDAEAGDSDSSNASDEMANKGNDRDIIEEEDRSVGALKGAIWYGVFKAAGGLPVVTMIFTAAVLQQSASVVNSLWLSWWSSDHFNLSGQEYMNIYGILGGAQMVALLCLNCSILLGGYLLSLHYHRTALDRLFRAPMSFFESQPIGRILSRFSKDIESIDQRIWVYFFFAIFSSFNLIGALALICTFFPVILALIVPLMGFYYLVLVFYRSAVRELKRLDANQRSPLYAHISLTLAGVPSIRAFMAEDRFVDRQRVLTDLSNSPRYLYMCIPIWVAVRIEVLASLVTLAVALLGATGAVSAAQIGLVITYALSLVDSIGYFLRFVALLESEMNAVERLDYYGKKLPSEDATELPSDPSASEWPKSGFISVSGLELRYASRPDHAVISDLSIDIAPGEKIGIVGRTGSGKSTLLAVMFRIIDPTAGSIKIDGVDISTIGLSTLRSRLQIITQEPMLFTGTLRTNLDMERRFSDNEIWSVLEMLGLKSFVADLTDKLEHVVDENGKNLSVGQRQLLCLGRAILYKSKVLFLDEATASVDPAADRLIQTSIRTHFAEATVVSIAHRLDTVAALDRVLVLAEGRAVEVGAPRELLRKPRGSEGAVFRKLAEATGPANFARLVELAEGRAGGEVVVVSED
ncbi:Multidrug resistance-associated protein 1 [Cladochytrium tenue]|nr:Multidrug resistance-associated protein 1 [Cladochytrium tenue]